MLFFSYLIQSAKVYRKYGLTKFFLLKVVKVFQKVIHYYYYTKIQIVIYFIFNKKEMFKVGHIDNIFFSKKIKINNIK